MRRLTTPVSILIGFVLVALAILITPHLGSNAIKNQPSIATTTTTPAAMKADNERVAYQDGFEKARRLSEARFKAMIAACEVITVPNNVQSTMYRRATCLDGIKITSP